MPTFKAVGFCATRGGDVGRPGSDLVLGTSPEPLIDSYRCTMSDMDVGVFVLALGLLEA